MEDGIFIDTITHPLSLMTVSPESPDKMTRFWQELKRRKVVRVISVYAAAAFVILELTSIVAPSLGLPTWTLNLVIILLFAGFIIATILSWIFDRHPEGGLVRTPSSVSGEEEPGHESREESTVSSSLWKKATYISLVLIVALILLNIFGGSGTLRKRKQNLAIAVLPIRNDSPDHEHDYIINGLLEAILNNLAKVEDLHVVSRTSIEQYRDSDKSMREIGKELQVNYILEGSATIINNSTRIYLQLIETESDRHLWSSPFQREINLDNLFDVQTEVALAVTGELKAILTPEEKEKIIKKPTENTAATNLYLHARNYMQIAKYKNSNNPQEIGEAKRLLEQAIELDPDFANALAWLGDIYIDNYHLSWMYRDIDKAYAYLDSGLVMVEKALALEQNNPVALYALASYYQRKGMHHRAEPILDKLSANEHKTYLYYEDAVYRYLEYEDYYHAIESYFRYLDLKPTDVLTPNQTLYAMYRCFRNTGYYEQAGHFAREMYRLSNDSVAYLLNLVNISNWKADYEAAIDYGLKAWNLDTSIQYSASTLLINYMYLNDTLNGFRFVRIIEEFHAKRGEVGTDIPPFGMLGYAYMLMGRSEQAEYHLYGSLSSLFKNIEYHTPQAQRYQTHLFISITYSVLKEDTKALEYLAYLKERKAMDLGYVNDLKYWPTFESIRDTPEFIEVLKHLEEVCRIEYERIGIFWNRTSDTYLPGPPLPILNDPSPFRTGALPSPLNSLMALNCGLDLWMEIISKIENVKI